MSRVIVITGPTATGKTAAGIALAKLLNGEIVSADSMQIYRRMDIGTAKPTPDERSQAVHHMLDVCDPEDNYSVSRYSDEASACVDDILSRGKTPIIVGGTGLYIDALLRGTGFAPKGDEAVRKKLEEEYEASGEEEFRARLSSVDPECEKRINANDRKRLVRAMEVYLLSGTPLSEFDRLSRLAPPRYESVRFALTYSSRDILYSRIDKRVDLMRDMGLKCEVEALLADGIDEKYTSMQAIGYKEYLRFLRGECDEAACIEDIKRESRRYAKRQMSWLRRDKDIHFIDREEHPLIADVAGIIAEYIGR